MTAYRPEQWHDLFVATAGAGTLPMVAAGISLIAAGGGGLYWLVAGFVLGFAGAVLNAWILLVEMHR
jgi:hypothetical protein